MTEEMRSHLYFLGFLASLAFSSRVIVQWISSEAQKKSVVTKSFWLFSLIGASLMILHSFIQLQYNVAVIQTINFVIYWRNLNLMQPAEKQYKITSVWLLIAISLMMTTVCFIFQGWIYFQGDTVWARTPMSFLTLLPQQDLSPLWHMFGLLGMILFAGRFWIQWWEAERSHVSILSSSFWWISLVGAFISIIYFAHLNDIANVIGPATGIIPYIRNLILIRKQKEPSYSKQEL